jgi:hypothetical protein
MPRILLTPEQPFKRVSVDYLIKGGARISWDMYDCIIDPEPWLFQVQVNRNADEPDEWEDLGDPLINTYYAVDSSQRLYGKDHRLAYRVILTTDSDTYTSQLANIYGDLSTRQWLLANAIIRRAKLERTQLTKPRAYLLKKKQYGVTCSCVDTLTRVVTDPDCELCDGTGTIDGYWNGEEILLYELSPAATANKLDDQLGRGTVDDATMRQCILIGEPFVMPKDVLVLSDSDQRYNIKEIKHLAEMGTVPLVSQLNLALLPYTDPVYRVDIS